METHSAVLTWISSCGMSFSLGLIAEYRCHSFNYQLSSELRMCGSKLVGTNVKNVAAGCRFFYCWIGGLLISFFVENKHLQLNIKYSFSKLLFHPTHPFCWGYVLSSADEPPSFQPYICRFGFMTWMISSIMKGFSRKLAPGCIKQLVFKHRAWLFVLVSLDCQSETRKSDALCDGSRWIPRPPLSRCCGALNATLSCF